MSRLQAIAVSYRSPQDLDGFCRSFERHPGTDVGLTIVNVDPNPDDMRIASWWADRIGAKVQTHRENVGYGRAVNAAAKDSDSEVLAAFNVDTRLTHRLLDDCVEALLSRDEWGILGPKQVNENGYITHAGIFGTHDAPAHRAWHQPDGPHLSDVRDDAVTVSGSAFFVKRSLWDELTNCGIYRAQHPEAQGAFLPTPHYYDETWACYHAHAHDKRVVYFGQSTMYHYWHKASAVGGWADQQMPISKAMFVRACQAHSIPHD